MNDNNNNNDDDESSQPRKETVPFHIGRKRLHHSFSVMEDYNKNAGKGAGVKRETHHSDNDTIAHHHYQSTHSPIVGNFESSQNENEEFSTPPITTVPGVPPSPHSNFLNPSNNNNGSFYGNTYHNLSPYKFPPKTESFTNNHNTMTNNNENNNNEQPAFIHPFPRGNSDYIDTENKNYGNNNNNNEYSPPYAAGSQITMNKNDVISESNMSTLADEGYEPPTPPEMKNKSEYPK